MYPKLIEEVSVMTGRAERGKVESKKEGLRSSSRKIQNLAVHSHPPG